MDANESNFSSRYYQENKNPLNFCPIRDYSRLFVAIASPKVACSWRSPAQKLLVRGDPEWIEDYRVDSFNEKIEKEICRVYSQSRLVIGLHGSNMLLPSAHAGMTIDLIDERWGNFAQDILYQESDPRMASFRYRFLPYQTSNDTLAFIAAVMVLNWSKFKSQMTADVL